MKRSFRHGIGWVAVLLIMGLVAQRIWHAPPTPSHSRIPVEENLSARSAAMPPAQPAATPPTFDEVLESMRPADAPFLLAFLTTLPPGPDRTAVAAELLLQWGREAPAAAIDYVVRDVTSANPLLAGLLAEPPQEQTSAEKMLDSSQEALATVLAALFANWAAEEPGAAALKALQLESASERELMLQVVSETWVRHDLASAVEWMRGLPAGPEHTRVLQSIADAWAARDPHASSAYATALPVGLARSHLLKTVAKNWAARDLSAAMGWIKTLPDDASRGEVVRNALASLAEAEPEAAADWLRQLPDGASQREGLDLVLNLWAARDLPSALTWFHGLPPGPLREHARPMLSEALAAALDP